MKLPGFDRIFFVTGLCGILASVGLEALTRRWSRPGQLGGELRIEPDRAAAAALGAFEATVARSALKPGGPARFEFPGTSLQFEDRAFYGEHELVAWREGLKRQDLYRGIGPPLDLEWRPAGAAIQLSWKSNPANEAIRRAVAGNPLLKTSYRLYRWRVGEPPAVIARVPMESTSFLDETAGPRGGRLFYSVLAVLEGRVGDQDTLIESERSEVLELDRESGFELTLVAGSAEQVVIEVTVGSEPNRHSARFEVSQNEWIGTLAAAEGASSLDFRTGLRVAEIRVVQESREQVLQHPVFNPDGSRASDGAGFLFREETRKIPIQRLEVRCEGEGGRTRVLSIDQP